MNMRSLIIATIFAVASEAFSPAFVSQRLQTPTQSQRRTQTQTQTQTSSSLEAIVNRKDFMNTFVVGVSAAAAAAALTLPSQALAASVGDTVTLESGVTYNIIKSGDGPKPTTGELAAIRFKAFAGSNKIDDIFDTPEPYYTRVGSGGMIKGVESTLPLMRVGDRWELTIPGSLAFGPKGRPSSAGKPRIPSDATIIFEVEMVGLPGKEPELIDLIGDD